MTVLKLCGIAVIGVCAALIMRAAKSELALPVGIITGIIILASAVSSMYPIVVFAEEISKGNSYSLYFSTVLKALGIGIAAQTASDICRDNGEGAIASKLEFAAKVGILLLGLPVIREILSLTQKIIE
ncbi:MAG: SpoIIIAC/SpoIIIAD family protein [Eubacteriales bacterium]